MSISIAAADFEAKKNAAPLNQFKNIHKKYETLENEHPNALIENCFTFSMSIYRKYLRLRRQNCICRQSFASFNAHIHQMRH